MYITSKGQVTIPVDVRTKLRLLPHTEVRIEVDGASARIIRVKSPAQGRGSRLVRHMQGKATNTMSTEDILRLTRQHG